MVVVVNSMASALYLSLLQRSRGGGAGGKGGTRTRGGWVATYDMYPKLRGTGSESGVPGFCFCWLMYFLFPIFQANLELR